VTPARGALPAQRRRCIVPRSGGPKPSLATAVSGSRPQSATPVTRLKRIVGRPHAAQGTGAGRVSM